MLEANDSWFVKELGWWGRHWNVENYLMEKIFVPHLYRIRKNLSKLKEEIEDNLEVLIKRDLEMQRTINLYLLQYGDEIIEKDKKIMNSLKVSLIMMERKK